MRPQTQYKLEYKLLFALVVAGKNAKFAQNVMQKLLDSIEPNLLIAPQDIMPFDYVRWLVKGGHLGSMLRSCRSGNYTKLERAFRAIVGANLDLRACTPQQLEEIPGIGPKTSRFYILWTRPNARYAALDTHILKWLRYLGYDAPLSTPSKELYAKLELDFLAEADKRGIKPAKLDYEIWEFCQQGRHKTEDWPKHLQRNAKTK